MKHRQEERKSIYISSIQISDHNKTFLRFPLTVSVRVSFRTKLH